MPTFAEFFAGAGFARLGLGSAWQCVFANEICPMKVADYRANFGDDHLVEGDIRHVTAAEVTVAIMWWLSFPCQDHSTAGRRKGFDEGERGKLVFAAMHLLHACLELGTAPKLIVLENVAGLLSAANGRDFTDVATALASAGYVFGALEMDARQFVPQSRPRVFILALRSSTVIPPGLAGRKPGPWHGPAIRRAASRLPEATMRNWRWWQMPMPAAMGTTLGDIVDQRGGSDQRWHSQTTVDRLLLAAGPADAARLAAARASGSPFAGTVMMRPTSGPGGKGRKFSFRDDGLAGCVMGKDSLHHQQLCIVEGQQTHIRPFSRPELARLMGLPPGYALPAVKTQMYRTVGDGVVVPVVRWLAENLLEPLATAADAGMRAPRISTSGPRAVARPNRLRKQTIATVPGKGVGMKQMTIGTTAYFLPDESARLRSVAKEMGTSFHEATIRAWDRLLAERGMPPVRRVPSARTR